MLRSVCACANWWAACCCVRLWSHTPSQRSVCAAAACCSSQTSPSPVSRTANLVLNFHIIHQFDAFIFCSPSVSSLRPAYGVLADAFLRFLGCHRPSIPALSLPGLWSGAAADAASDRCGAVCSSAASSRRANEGMLGAKWIWLYLEDRRLFWMSSSMDCERNLQQPWLDAGAVLGGSLFEKRRMPRHLRPRRGRVILGDSCTRGPVEFDGQFGSAQVPKSTWRTEKGLWCPRANACVTKSGWLRKNTQRLWRSQDPVCLQWATTAPSWEWCPVRSPDQFARQLYPPKKATSVCTV